MLANDVTIVNIAQLYKADVKKTEAEMKMAVRMRER